MTYNNSMVFIETSLFTKKLRDYLNDDEYRELQLYLIEHPGKGDLICGGGGIRKLRWSRSGMGKLGGVRVIYCWATPIDQIYLLTIYSKSEQTNIDTATLNQIVKKLETIK